MVQNETASLTFPVTCLVISLAVTSYLHRTWITQQMRAFKCLIRRASRKTKRQIQRRLQQVRETWGDENTYEVLEPSTQPDTAHFELSTYSANARPLCDSENISTDSASRLDTDDDSDTTTSTENSTNPHSPPSRPTWILDSTGQYVLNRAPEMLPRAQWEIELDQRIRNGRGPGASLDKLIDWGVRLVVDAEMRAQIKLSAVERR